MGKKKSIADLKPGESGTICCFSDEKLSLKLLDMGCLPGTEVEFQFSAPLGDPICIEVDGYSLTLRKEEASTVSLI